MLRNEKMIHIGGKGDGGQDVTVLEVSVEQLGDAMTLLSQVSGGSGENLPALAGKVLAAKDGPALRLLHGMSSLGPDIDAVGGCALMDIGAAWVEVNQPFFDRIRTMGEKLLKKPASPDPSAKATAQAA
jgi:hypothetical protein